VDQPEATTTLEYPFANPTRYADVRTVLSDPPRVPRLPAGW
jgi:hypothetical protein